MVYPYDKRAVLKFSDFMLSQSPRKRLNPPEPQSPTPTPESGVGICVKTKGGIPGALRLRLLKPVILELKRPTVFRDDPHHLVGHAVRHVRLDFQCDANTRADKPCHV